MKEAPWRITVMELRHVQPMVGTHLQAFPDFFLSILGPRFLNEGVSQ